MFPTFLGESIIAAVPCGNETHQTLKLIKRKKVQCFVPLMPGGNKKVTHT